MDGNFNYTALHGILNYTVWNRAVLYHSYHTVGTVRHLTSERHVLYVREYRARTYAALCYRQTRTVCVYVSAPVSLNCPCLQRHRRSRYHRPDSRQAVRKGIRRKHAANLLHQQSVMR